MVKAGKGNFGTLRHEEAITGKICHSKRKVVITAVPVSFRPENLKELGVRSETQVTFVVSEEGMKIPKVIGSFSRLTETEVEEVPFRRAVIVGELPKRLIGDSISVPVSWRIVTDQKIEVDNRNCIIEMNLAVMD